MAVTVEAVTPQVGGAGTEVQLTCTNPTQVTAVTVGGVAVPYFASPGGRSAAAYYQAVLGSGPGAFWELADTPGSTTAADSSTTGSNPATVYGTVTFGRPDAWGGSAAANLDGTTGYLVAPKAVNLGTAAYTLEGWYASTVWDGGILELDNLPTLAATAATPAMYTGYARLYGRSQGPTGATGANNGLQDPTVQSCDGLWHHGVVTYDGAGTLTVYLDGTPVINSTTAGNTAFNGYWHLGWARRGGGLGAVYWSGSLAGLAYYQRALPAGEVAAHYTATDPGLVTLIVPSGLLGGTTPIVLTANDGTTTTTTTVTWNYQEPVLPGSVPAGTGRHGRLYMADGTGRSLPLDDPGVGYVTVELDTGYGTPREVVNNRPDARGTDDETSLPGSRTVTLTLAAWGERLTLDEIIHLFGPYLVPSARPELHWSEASSITPSPQRMLTLRPSTWASPMSTPDSRTLTLGWVAPDPAAYDPNVQQVQAWAAGVLGGGRTYPLTYPRLYTATIGGGASALMSPGGDYPVQPRITMYGPADQPSVTISPAGGQAGGSTGAYLTVATNAALDDGDYLAVDTAANTALYYDASTGSTTDAMGLIDWVHSVWQAVPAGVRSVVTYTAGNASGTTEAAVTWQDAYL